MKGNWFHESLHDGYRQSFEIGTTLYHDKTDFQEMIIFDTPRLGRVLVLDGVVQTTQADEFYYHEMMTHLPILAHGACRRVAIVGGGDGGALREVLKHPGIERAVMIEIDPRVVELSKTYLPTLSQGAFDDPRAELVFADGTTYIAEQSEAFDVIMVDSTDPIGPSIALFENSFYRDCHKALKPGGILIRQAGVPFFQRDEYRVAMARIGSVFKDPALALVAVPTYCGGAMALAWGSDRPELRRHPAETLAARFAQSGIRTRYYTPEIHAAAFSLPAFMVDALASPLSDTA